MKPVHSSSLLTAVSLPDFISIEHANHKKVCLRTVKMLMRYLSDCVCLHRASSPGNLTGRNNGVILYRKYGLRTPKGGR